MNGFPQTIQHHVKWWQMNRFRLFKRGNFYSIAIIICIEIIWLINVLVFVHSLNNFIEVRMIVIVRFCTAKKNKSKTINIIVWRNGVLKNAQNIDQYRFNKTFGKQEEEREGKKKNKLYKKEMWNHFKGRTSK